MKKSDGLFDLIHSLTPGEKRHFKMTAGGQKAMNKKYLLLFATLEKQSVYDQKLLRKELKGEPFLRELHVTKNYLFETILRSLRQYHAKKTARNTILLLLENHVILFDRSLFHLSFIQLQKAKKIARKHYFHTLQTEILYFELRLATQARYSEKNIDYIRSLYSEIQGLLELSKTNYAVSELANTVFAKWVYGGRNRTKEGDTEFDAALQTVQEEFSTRPNDEFTKTIFYDLNKNYYYSKGMYKEAFEYARMNLEIFQNYRDLRESSSRSYLIAINDFYMCLLGSSFIQRPDFMQYENIEKILQEIEKIPNVEKSIESYKIVIASGIRLSWCIYMKEYDLGISICKTFEKVLPKHARKCGKGLEGISYFYFARLYFSYGDFSTALEWINKILNDKAMVNFEDIACSARLFSLIIYFELKEFVYLNYAIRNTYRFLKQKKHLHSYEQHILQFLKRAAKVRNKEDQVRGMETLYKSLKPLQDDRGERAQVSFFRFDWWVESKISNKSLLT